MLIKGFIHSRGERWSAVDYDKVPGMLAGFSCKIDVVGNWLYIG